MYVCRRLVLEKGWRANRNDRHKLPTHLSKVFLSYLGLEDCSLREAYKKTKEICESKKLPPDVNLGGVFACNEIDLEEVTVYGFDYDYTLAVYKSTLDQLLYNLSRDNLIHKFKYPKGIKNVAYDPYFAIRGLHYDIEKGLLMKLDSFLQIQLGTVYKGRTKVPNDKVLQTYKNRTVPLAYVETHAINTQPKYYSSKMVQLADLFSVTEICLMCNVTEFFEKNNIDYHPEILFWDVKEAVSASHPIMHQILQKDMEKYLHTNPGILQCIERLSKAGKELFLITNSPYSFVNRGMSLMLGKEWEKYFDVVIVNARKPMFFTDKSRPIRLYDKKSDCQLWDRVTSLQKGTIYFEGTIHQLEKLTGWRGNKVLYFGDHPYTDLADATLVHGWRTGAIIKELKHEIQTLNTSYFKKHCNWLQMLTQLIEECQARDEPDAEMILEEWANERDKLRMEMKEVFNKQFGSVFRTYNNPTYFSRRLFRFADIYTSSLTNLLNYSVNHVFYPRRGVMPHEYTSYFM